MKNNIIKLAIGTGLVTTLALVMLVAVPKAEAAYVYTENITAGQDMTIGSTGQRVVVLQGLMSELGYLNVPFGIPLGYYGTMTKSAVANYQAAQRVAPAVGYFGPITKVAMHQEFAGHNWLTLLGW